MIADGTAVAAWEHDELAPFDVDSLSRERALEMISEGRRVRRVLGVHALEDQPSIDPELSPEERAYHEFRERAFEARANRSRGGRRGQRIRGAA